MRNRSFGGKIEVVVVVVVVVAKRGKVDWEVVAVGEKAVERHGM